MAAKRKSKSSRAREPWLQRQVAYAATGLVTLFGWAGSVVLFLAHLLRKAVAGLAAAFGHNQARKPLALLSASVGVLAVVAMLDFDSTQPGRNLCGSFGWHVADLLLYALGVAAYLPAAFVAFWGVVVVVRDGETQFWSKAFGVLTTTLVAALAFRAWFPETVSTTFVAGAGGWLGANAYPPLRTTFGPVGLGLLLTATGLLSLMMATEWGFVPLMRELFRDGMAGLKTAREARRSAVSLAEPPVPEPQFATLPSEGSSPRRGRIAALWHSLFGSFHPHEERAGEATPSAHQQAPPSAEPPPEPELPPTQALEPAAPPTVDPPAPSLPTISGEDTSKRRRRSKIQPVMAGLPSVEMLAADPGVGHSGAARAEIDDLGQRLQGSFDAYGLNARVVGAERGPTLTLFEVQLATGVRVNSLVNLRNDLGVALGSHGVRVVYPLPGRTTVGIEVPNHEREVVRLRSLVDFDRAAKMQLPIYLGRDTLGKPAVEDLAKMPHLLIAGSTGSGKSVCINSILLSLLLTRTPDQVRLILVDPKQVELHPYGAIPHLLTPVVTRMKRAPFVLEWGIRQMEDRLSLCKQAGVRNILDYNKLGEEELRQRVGEEVWNDDEPPTSIPYIVIVIDELADLMMQAAKEVEISISRLAAKARAAGIHLVVATQRPSTDVVTGLIKTNMPVRIGFQVTSGIDSRVVLDEPGAEDLVGNGDFLYRPPGASGLIRGQGAFVSEREVTEICKWLADQGRPEFLEDLTQGPAKGKSLTGEADDDLYEDAVRVILKSGRGSASLLQRALQVGYTRASRLVDMMTEQGVLGPHTGSKARELMITLEQFEAQLQQKQKSG